VTGEGGPFCPAAVHVRLQAQLSRRGAWCGARKGETATVGQYASSGLCCTDARATLAPRRTQPRRKMAELMIGMIKEGGKYEPDAAAAISGAGAEVRV